MKSLYVLSPVLLSVLLLVALDQLSHHGSNSNEACAQSIRAHLLDPSTYAQIAAEYKRGDETWGRDEMMLEVANELDRLTPAESSRLRSDDGAARATLARDLKPKFAALLPAEGTHFGFAISKIDFDAQNQADAVIRHVAYCKFLVVDGADAHEPFSTIIDEDRQ
jgi:hypothetical protein